jgi:hypothetical protein
VLDHRLVAVLRHGRGDELVAAAAELPVGLLEEGVVGLQTVDAERLSPVLASLKDRVAGAKRVAVVLPTGWLRCHLLEFEHLPRRAAEVTDVVRWRLKKLLPVNPAELRLSVLPLSATGERRTVATLAGFERALAGLERAFAAAGMEPGYLGPALLAARDHGADAASSRLLVQHDERVLALTLSVDGRLRLLRTKPLASAGDTIGALEREMNLTLHFIRDRLTLAGELAVEILSGDREVAARLEAWWRGQPGVALRPALTMPAVSPPGVAARLEPAWRLLRGGGA